jgi:hypothetical protein
MRSAAESNVKAQSDSCWMKLTVPAGSVHIGTPSHETGWNVSGTARRVSTDTFRILSFLNIGKRNQGVSDSIRMGAKLLLMATALWIALSLLGCVYRMPVGSLPSQQRFRDYEAPADGQITVSVPGFRPGCSVYLFDTIRVRSGADP